MKLLQKILFVLMVGLSLGKADGLQFSDPRGIGAPPVVVAGGVMPGLGAGAIPLPPGNYVGFDVNNINLNQGRIYFPADGIQPDANLVGRLARAIGGNSVTNWYIEAFGGAAGLAASAPGAVPIGLPQMGFVPPAVLAAPGPAPVGLAAPAHIITLNAVGAPPNFVNDFWQAFRAIANTADGRELLYRILIEIRRIDPGHANRHCYASSTERIGGMSLTVTHSANTAFVNKGSITFSQAHTGDLINALQKYYSFLTTFATLPNDLHNVTLQIPDFHAENVINIPGATTANDQFTHVRIPVNHGGVVNADIYFPIDGHQPTTHNVDDWSCAYVDNRENSPITN